MKSLLIALSSCSLLLIGLITGCGENPVASNSGTRSEPDPAAVQDTAGTVEGAGALIDLEMPATADQSPGKLFPVDEGQVSPAFVRFRSDLLDAVRRKDTAFVMQLVDRNSKISFGGEGGKNGFRIMWGLGSDYRASPLWDVLDQVLRLGGQFADTTQRVFIAPYVYAMWPDAYDAFTHGAITGSRVRVREKPGTEAAVLGALTYDIVGYSGTRTPHADTIGSDAYPWYQVTLDDGRTGWVFGKYFRSPIDFRAAFERAADGWRLQFLVAGD